MKKYQYSVLIAAVIASACANGDDSGISGLENAGTFGSAPPSTPPGAATRTQGPGLPPGQAMRPTAGAQPQLVAVTFIDKYVGRTDKQPTPFVLFNNNRAKDWANVVTPGFDVAMDLLADPGNWRQWVRSPDGQIQRDFPNGMWAPLDYRYEAKPQPAGTTLNGSYYFQKLTPGAEGSATVTFSSDGRFVSCDGDHGQLSHDRPEDALVRTLADQAGTYKVDGFMITLNFNSTRSNGPVTRSGPFFYVPEIDAVWINDDYYPAEARMPDKFICKPPQLPSLEITPPPPPTMQANICGNNMREGNELCDGTDLGGMTCVSMGSDFGELKCNSRCTYDTIMCQKNRTGSGGTSGGVGGFGR